MDTKLGTSDPRRTRRREQMQTVRLIRYLSMVCLIPLPGSRFPVSTRDSPCTGVLPWSVFDNNAYEILENPEGVD